MQESNIGFLPAIDAQGQVSGVVTDRDLAVRVVGEMYEITQRESHGPVPLLPV
jgi:CBS domain-containing protein